MFAIPSLSDLVQRARMAFRAELPGSDAWLWPNNVNPSAKVMGGAVHEVFGFADYIQRQKFALTADGDNLDLHGEELGLSRKPAAPARGFVNFVATDALAVNDGAVLRRADDIEYSVLTGGSLQGAGTLSIEVVATTSGKTTTSISGTALDIVSGVTGDALVNVAPDGVTGGADVEPDGEPFTSDLATFRGRILFRKRNPPHGGAPADYVLWASSVAGVRRVFVERRWGGVGTVRVFPLMDDLYPNGIAPAGEIARVRDYLDTVAPAGAPVTVAAPTSVSVPVQIAGLSPDNTDVRNAVLAELTDAFFRLSRVAGSDEQFAAMPFLAYPTSFARSWVWQAVANAADVDRDAILAPAADVPLVAGQIATLGTGNFVPSS